MADIPLRHIAASPETQQRIREQLALGTAATASSSAFATAAQGTRADIAYNREVYLGEAVGAVGNGIADDSAALAAAIALLPKGGTIHGVPGKVYYFADPPALPRGVRLIGQTIPGKPRTILPAKDDYACTIILPAGKSIVVGDQAEFAHWLVYRQGLVTPTYPIGLSIEEAEAIIAAYAGRAVDVVGDDAHVHHNMILGFQWAIRVKDVFRPGVYQNHFDCTNGIEATGIYDAGELPGISENRGWGYVFGSMPYPWRVSRRAGSAFYFHDGCDGLIAERNFAYGYNKGVWLMNVYGVKTTFWIDNFGLHAPEDINGAIGVVTEGNCSNCSLSGHVDGQNINYYFLHSAGKINAIDLTSGVAVSNQLKFGPSSAGQIIANIGGGAHTPILFDAGVGKWSGRIVSSSTASGGSLVFLMDFAGDLNKLVDLAIDQIGTTYFRAISNVLIVPFSGLPSNPSEGDTAIVTDSTVTAYGSVIAGGGGDTVFARYLVGAWRVG